LKLLRTISPYIVILGLVVLVIVLVTSLISPEEVTYTEFVRELSAGNVKSVEITDNTATIKLKANSASDEKLKEGQYVLQIKSLENFDKMMLDEVKGGRDVEYKNEVQDIPFVVEILPYILLVVVFFVFMYVMLGQGQNGSGKPMSFSKSRARLYTTSKITFENVAGAKEEKEEMMELVSFLKNPKQYSLVGARIPKGVLMVGPPGTGKTYLAKAVAGEAGVPFFSISGSDFVEMFVGVGASRVRDLFEQAKKHQPCIIFIDEIDAVGRQRGAGLGGGHDEREQTLNQLLVEMDGFDENVNIIVIAATNRPDILDNALLRPGRFDRQIVINRPDILGREQILNVHAKNKPLSKDVELKILAKRTPGFTGADLQNLLNEAALLAARHDQKEINMDNLEEAIDKVMAGPEKKSRIITDEEKENTAYHEVGHALLAKLLKNTDPLHKVSIIPRGMALGITMTLPEKDHLTLKKSQLLDRITMTLGGRVAEELVYGKDSITTGASNDLEKVTALARNMVTTYGMSEKMGSLQYGKNQEHVFMGRNFGHTRDFSEEIAAEIDKEVKRIVDEQYEIARNLLNENRDMLEYISKTLLDEETIDEKRFVELMEKVESDRG